jgi:hypothetical protein
MLNSNHTPYHLDGSLRRRLWFLGFCDYYHAADDVHGVKEHTPAMEFKNALVTGYDEREKNLLYNFLAQCVVCYLKFKEKVESPMQSITNRNIQSKIGDRFREWAEDYFTPDKLNTLLVRNEIWESYIENFSDKERRGMTNDKWFKDKLEYFAILKGWLLNPDDIIGTNKDNLTRKRIRFQADGKWIEQIYFRTFNPNFDEKEGETSQNSDDSTPF